MTWEPAYIPSPELKGKLQQIVNWAENLALDARMELEYPKGYNDAEFVYYLVHRIQLDAGDLIDFIETQVKPELNKDAK